MNRLIMPLIVAVLLSGCHKHVRLIDSLETVGNTAKHEIKRFPLKRYDTKETARMKLLLADAEIINLNNKLFIVRKQVHNLKDALEEKNIFSRLLTDR